MSKSPTYLQLGKNGMFHFRIAIPPDIRVNIGKREIKKSLWTSNRNHATILAQQLYLQIAQLFSEARMANTKSPYPDLGTITLRTTKPGKEGPEVNEVIVEADTPEQEMDIAKELLEIIKGSPQALKETVNAAEESLLSLSELIEKYSAEKIHEGSWLGGTQDEFVGIFKRLVDIIGDLPVGGIGFDQARYYKDVLKKLPPHLNKLQKYKGMTVIQRAIMTPL